MSCSASNRSPARASDFRRAATCASVSGSRAWPAARPVARRRRATLSARSRAACRVPAISSAARRRATPSAMRSATAADGSSDGSSDGRRTGRRTAYRTAYRTAIGRPIGRPGPCGAGERVLESRGVAERTRPVVSRTVDGLTSAVATASLVRRARLDFRARCLDCRPAWPVSAAHAFMRVTGRVGRNVLGHEAIVEREAACPVRETERSFEWLRHGARLRLLGLAVRLRDRCERNRDRTRATDHPYSV